MKDLKDLIPWKVTDISLRPYEGYWSFNPSIHFDGTTWRCVLRCCDYAMPGGVTIRSKGSRQTGQQTKNAMVILDPTSWRVISTHKMVEKDDYPRVATPHLGYEDMRIFKTDHGGLQGIAASLHLRRDRGPHVKDSTPQHQPPEQVLVSFDGDYNIVTARPIRGDSWSGTPQKNWVPFDHCVEPRFLYSIGRGTLFDDHGELHGSAAVVHPSHVKEVVPAVVPVGTPVFSRPSSETIPAAAPLNRDEKVKTHSKITDRRILRGGDVQLVRGRRISLDALSSRPSAIRSGTRMSSDASRIISGSRLQASKYNGLRGGTQLVCVGGDRWLGLGHEMKFVDGKKYYWHTWYVVNAQGKMLLSSEPMKLAQNGIEFAAGMGIDNDRVVVSFGVDDMECKVGETRLSAVMEILRPL